MKRQIRTSEIAPMATRMMNAENSFIDAVKEQFGFSEAEAVKILSVFKSHKVVKISANSNNFTLTHGAYWERYVMENALAA